jgi:malate synthase
MEMLIDTCKRRSAPATTGMVPFVLSQLPPGISRADAIQKAKDAKRLEALAGSDGALVYDLELVQPIQQVFSEVMAEKASQHSGFRVGYGDGIADKEASRATLLSVPSGLVSRRSVATNLRVVLAYVLAWFAGKGTAVVDGCVEDSATAEISRAQLWQWVHHQTRITEDGTLSQPVTAALVREMLDELASAAEFSQNHSRAWLAAAHALVMQLATSRTPPTFITTFLLEQHALTSSLARSE